MWWWMGLESIEECRRQGGFIPVVVFITIGLFLKIIVTLKNMTELLGLLSYSIQFD